MSKIYFLFLCITAVCFSAWNTKAQQKDKSLMTRFEQTQGQETVTYAEGIAYLETLAQTYPEIKLITYGTTDSGFPLHLVVFSQF